MANNKNYEDDYDYGTQNAALTQKQKIAELLMKGAGEGQMVSGWYVPPAGGGWGQAVASLGQVLGGYMQGKNANAAAELAAKDREVTFKNYNELINGQSPEQMQAIQARAAEQYPDLQPQMQQMNIPNKAPVAPWQQPVAPTLTGQAMSQEPVVAPDPVPQFTQPTEEQVAALAEQRQQFADKAQRDAEQQNLAMLYRTKGGADIAERVMETKLNQKIAGKTKKNLVTVNHGDGSQEVMYDDDPRLKAGYRSTGKPVAPVNDLDERKFELEKQKANSLDKYREASLRASIDKRTAGGVVSTNDAGEDLDENGLVSLIKKDKLGNRAIPKEIVKRYADMDALAGSASSNLPLIRDAIVAAPKAPSSGIGNLTSDAATFFGTKGEATLAREKLTKASNAGIGLLEDPRVSGVLSDSDVKGLKSVLQDPNESPENKIAALKKIEQSALGMIARRDDAFDKLNPESVQRLRAQGLGPAKAEEATMSDDERKALAKGWKKNADGTWSKK